MHFWSPSPNFLILTPQIYMHSSTNSFTGKYSLIRKEVLNLFIHTNKTVVILHSKNPNPKNFKMSSCAFLEPHTSNLHAFFYQFVHKKEVCALTSWRTIGWKDCVSCKVAFSAGMAPASCICPNANAASCASKLDLSHIAGQQNPPKNPSSSHPLLAMAKLDAKLKNKLCESKPF